MSEQEKPWTAERFRKERMFDDEHWRKYEAYTNAEVVTEFKKMTKALGISPVPTLQNLSENDINNGSIGGVTFMSRQDHYYIHIEPELSKDDALDILAHELGHVKLGHLKPEQMANELNQKTNQLNREQEMAADDVAAILCRGRSNATYYQQKREHLEKDAARFGLPLDTFYRGNDPSHPRLDLRAAALIAAAEREEAAGRCPVIKDTNLSEQQEAGAPSTRGKPAQQTNNLTPN